MSDKETKWVFYSPPQTEGIKFFIRPRHFDVVPKVGYFTIGCGYYNILCNIITPFDGRINISVVCMAKLTDVPIASVT